MAILTCFALVAAALILTLVYFRKKFQYFTERGIDGPKPTMFGNLKETLFKRKHITYEIDQIYR
jgi:hypothetical protein